MINKLYKYFRFLMYAIILGLFTYGFYRFFNEEVFKGLINIGLASVYLGYMLKDKTSVLILSINGTTMIVAGIVGLKLTETIQALTQGIN